MRKLVRYPDLSDLQRNRIYAPHAQACEPTAHQLQVTVGVDSVTVPVSPPTPVCSHGALRMSPLAAT